MSDEQPHGLEDAVRSVLATLSSEERAELRAVSEGGVESRWFWLWGERAALCAELSGSEEGRSSAILKATWNHLNGRPVTGRLRSLQRAYTCPTCAREAIAEGWEPAELDRAVREPCRRGRCEEIGARRAEAARRTAAVKDRFARARALGLAFQAAHRTDGGTDGGALVALAASRFEADAEFRALWRAVYDVPPGTSHAEWLRHWIAGRG